VCVCREGSLAAAMLVDESRGNRVLEGDRELSFMAQCALILHPFTKRRISALCALSSPRHVPPPPKLAPLLARRLEEVMSVCSFPGASDPGLVKCAIECCLAVHKDGDGSSEAEGEGGGGWGQGGDASITILHGLCKVMGNPDWVGMASPLTAEELASVFGCIVDLSMPLPNQGASHQHIPTPTRQLWNPPSPPIP
jgi:hypothetical protein